MSRPSLLVLLAAATALLIGCREPLDFDRAFTADPDRGARLIKQNCANTCHPDNAFGRKKVKTFEELAYTVREYYEQVLGADNNYSQQDVFDMSRHLNDKYYHFKTQM